jgi:hypothetical protein
LLNTGTSMKSGGVKLFYSVMYACLS